MSNRQELLTRLGHVLMTGTPTTSEVPIPDVLSMSELSEWLEGAGFTLQATVEVYDDSCQVWYQTSVAEWPPFVTVVTTADGEVTTQQHWSEDDVPRDSHVYDPSCRCQACVDEYRVRLAPRRI